MAYIEMETPLIKNTIMQKRTDDKTGETLSYRICPENGYMLHEITHDEHIFDEEGNDTGEVIKGYTTGLVTAGASYDFTNNPREIYAVKEDNN